jgi:hypothetical protein
MARARQFPAILGDEDIGLAARTLARLSDAHDGALAALAWCSVNMWRAAHAGEDEPEFPLSFLLECLIEYCEADRRLRRNAPARHRLRALAALATALAADSDVGDPTGGSMLFHHGGDAPDWALARSDGRPIGTWRFYCRNLNKPGVAA